MAEEQKSLEMRVAELEDKLSKVLPAEGAGAAPIPAVCAIQQCIISQCIIHQCIISQCIRPCIIQQCYECSCGPCAATGGSGMVGGAGFGGLGRYLSSGLSGFSRGRGAGGHDVR